MRQKLHAARESDQAMMRERLTHSYGTEDQEPEQDWVQEEDEPDAGPRVLWGRVFALGAVVVLAVVLGRASAGGGASQGQVDRLESELSKAQETIAQLEAQIDAQAAAEDPAGTTEPGPGATPDTVAGEKTYTVQAGDTLRAIAERFYQDVALDDFLARANGITDASQLSVGQELTIPPQP